MAVRQWCTRLRIVYQDKRQALGTQI